MFKFLRKQLKNIRTSLVILFLTFKLKSKRRARFETCQGTRVSKCIKTNGNIKVNFFSKYTY